MSGSDRGQGSSALANPRGDSGGGQERAERNQQSDNQGATIALPVKQATGPSETQSAQTQAQTEQPDPYTLRDLIAQEDMAYWAGAMFVAAALTFIVTSIGTFLIWRQVKLTREAVEDTGRATDAMVEQNQLSMEGMRPWLEIDVAYDFISKSDDNRFTMSVIVTLRNNGKLPARNANMDHFMNPPVHRNPVPDFRAMAEMPIDERAYKSQMIVLPGGTSSDQELIFVSKENSVFENEVLPSFMIVVTYELPNGTEARSAAWFSVGPKGKDGKPTPIQWADDPRDREFAVEHMGYMIVT